MSLRYSCIKNKFTKRSVYIELLKTQPTEKNTFIQNEASNVLAIQK